MEQDIVKHRYIVEMVLNKLRIFANREEYSQVGLIALWKALEKYDASVGELEPYLYMQVRYQVMNELKRTYRQFEREMQDEQLFLYLPQEEDGREVSEEILVLLDALSEEERLLIKYAYFYGYKAKELAKIFGVAEETVKKRKQRIIKKLRKALAED